MKKLLKKSLALVGLYHPSLGYKISQARKAEILLEHKLPSMSVFVETGTNRGGMIEALRPHFKEIHSVELDEGFFNAAVQKFRGEEGIRLYHGDSAQVMTVILKHITAPALFWLDAHGSGAVSFDNSPIKAELRAVLGHAVQGHIILVDDARHFSRGDIGAIKRLARERGYRCVIEEGLFRLTPENSPYAKN